MNILIEINELENSCFVVMPFNSLYQSEYETIIKPAVEELNIKCVRGDEIYSKQRIMDDIWSSIRSCRLVIAELTGRNPNVLYEVGLAHAIGKPVIILTRNSEDVPFDLKDLRYLFYDTNDPFWGENLKIGLKKVIEKVLDNPDIDKYLEGINPIKKSEFPELPKKSPKTKANLAVIDVTGNWKGSWKANSILHNIMLHINQKGNLLSCVATINYYDDELTVVQQVFDGFVEENLIKIRGVNYTYIERGESKNYFLDNFTLTLSKDKLIGKASDEKNNHSEIILARDKKLK